MKKIALLVVLSLSIAAGCGERSADGVSIDSAEAHALVAHGATLLDVRTPDEWAAGHIDGAVLIPVQELDARITELPREHPVVVYCASGVRSARAVATLRAAGYDARDLGGMSRWGG